ncbi:hypothetical protein COW81_00605 [Candidatus Campbellbacteria bacterium CG22_combo_CG10-13_8_21_14_all_36_13]|uniref:DUF5671 domain-containing protein n=1 Tax=Candidatus Campbellbacteria bacterium CG22_combo_CG10-13_8_21_14_all_36_13 TaxID=1974529 RepID=A0A2H0DYV8_9BACT|nr:MAG: hypothetical protein COW81_00605 [Candidatus Campbellbacteria bacterium CG22_combo_CG10-13_8_21_14_all_36_13]
MVNQELFNFVKGQLSEGVSRERIKSILISQGGWSGEAIDEVLNLEELFNVKQKTKFIRYYALVFIIIFVLLLIFSVYILSLPDVGLMAMPAMAIPFIYGSTILPLAVVSFLTKNRKTSITLNMILSAIFLLPLLMILLSYVYN